MRLCFATRNANKLLEVKKILPDWITLIGLDDINCQEELPETQDTIVGNSLQKAWYIWENYQTNCFADDSGLEVEALNGEPGVDSAFYSGERDFDKNIQKLLENLGENQNRKAQFKTVITLVIEGKIQQFIGIAKGEILSEKRGEGGFGYDSIFLPEVYSETFAEMSLEKKNEISHRSKAFHQLVEYLQDFT